MEHKIVKDIDIDEAKVIKLTQLIQFMNHYDSYSLDFGDNVYGGNIGDVEENFGDVEENPGDSVHENDSSDCDSIAESDESFYEGD